MSNTTKSHSCRHLADYIFSPETVPLIVEDIVASITTLRETLDIWIDSHHPEPAGAAISTLCFHNQILCLEETIDELAIYIQPEDLS